MMIYFTLMTILMILMMKNNFMIMILIDFMIILLTLNIYMSMFNFYLLYCIFINIMSAVMGISFLVLNSRYKSNFKNFLYKE